MKNKIKLFLNNGLMLRIVLLLTVSLILYYTTCMKSPGWGDGSKFQLTAKKLYMNVSALSHPLYILISKMFYQIPFGSDTIKINSVSIIFGVLTLLVLFNILYLTLQTDKSISDNTAGNLALFGSFILMISHTFWLHCIITEVYTLNTFMESLSFYFLLLYIIKENKKYFLLSLFIMTLGLSNHLLCILLYPSAIYIFIDTGLYKDKDFIFKTIFVLLIGSTFLIFLYLKNIFELGIYVSTDIATGGVFRGTLLNQNWANLYDRYTYFLFFYIYQFSPLGFLMGIFGLLFFISNIKKYSEKTRKIFITFIIVFVCHSAFGFLYNVDDKFAFYLPAYIFFVVFLLFGSINVNLFYGKYNEKFKKAGSYIILNLCLILIIITYIVMPMRLQKSLLKRIDFVSAANSYGALYNGRTTKDNIKYLLFPFKIKHSGSETVKKYFMKFLDDKGVIIANWQTWSTLMYFKIMNTNTKTPEVQDVPLKEQILFIENNIDKRPIYFGSADPKFEIVNKLPKIYKLKPIGPFLKIEKVKK